MLHARTEGWAAGLRLAALSLAGHPDPERFAAEFSGSERTVAEYLLAEVLERQSQEVRRLLLRTSILEQVNGELAECGPRINGYGSFNCTWSAGVVWFARRGRLLSGAMVRPGDAIVGLQETGCRSNGYSLVRHILQHQHGDAWHTVPIGDTTLGAMALQPSRIYAAAVVDMLGGVHGEPQVELHGVVHVTGGGVPGKLGRLLRRVHLGAEITDPLPPGPLLAYLQEHGPVSDYEAYRVWNMGQGMLLITPQPEAAIAVAREHGMHAQVIGEITAQPGLHLCSRGYFCDTEQRLHYDV